MAMREVLKWIMKREDWLAKHASVLAADPRPHLA